jgi:hypothetical protein
MFIRASAFWVILTSTPLLCLLRRRGPVGWVGGARKPDGSGCLVFIPDNRTGWAPVAPAQHQHAPSGKQLTPESIETVK